MIPPSWWRKHPKVRALRYWLERMPLSPSAGVIQCALSNFVGWWSFWGIGIHAEDYLLEIVPGPFARISGEKDALFSLLWGERRD
jgi:hypothetical protein